MKRLILAALFCLCATPAFAAITFVTGTNTSAGGANGATTTGVDTTGANLCVAVVSYYNLGHPTVSDSVGGNSNTWNSLTPSDVGFSAGVTIWYSAVTHVGTGHTFTIAGGSTFSSIATACFAGVAASPFDLEAGSTTGSGTTLPVGPVTPLVNDELVITGLSNITVSSYTIDSGFTKLEDLTYTPGAYLGVTNAYLIQTTAGATNPTWTANSGGTMAAAIATFKASTGGGSTFPPGIINTPIRCCQGVK